MNGEKLKFYKEQYYYKFRTVSVRWTY